MDKIQTIAHDLSKVLLDLAKVPTMPQGGFSDSCAHMLIALETKKTNFSEILFTVNSLVSELRVLTQDASSETPLHRLCKICCDTEKFFSDFSVSAARTAKRVDAGERSASEYERLIKSAGIRLHDLGIEAEHIAEDR